LHNFIIFVKIYDFIDQKVHLNVKGFLILAGIIHKLNKPLSPIILNRISKLGVLPDIDLNLPDLDRNPLLDPFWISGFICGEGCFSYGTKTNYTTLNKTYHILIEVSQHSKDSFILIAIHKHFSVGYILHESRGISKFRVSAKSPIINTIFPHFDKYPLVGYKFLQYSIWKDIVNIKVLNPVRTPERDLILQNLIKKLSDL